MTVSLRKSGIYLVLFSTLLFILASSRLVSNVYASGLVWSTKSNMTTPRYLLSAVTGSNNKIYVLGGYNSSTDVGTVEEYDPSSDTWTTKADMPTPRNGFEAVATPDGKIYAFGGYSAATHYTPVVEKYDIATDSWTTLADMPDARANAGSALGSNGKIYIIGGSDSTGSIRDTVFEYNPATDQWATKSPMPTTITELSAAAAVNGKIYAIGGEHVSNGPEKYNEEYDPASDTWTTKADMPTGRIVLAVTGAINGKIYALGGLDGNTSAILGTVEAYDPTTDTWSSQTDMPTPRYGLAVATVDSKIYAFGGTGISGPNYFTTNEEALISDLSILTPTADTYLNYYAQNNNEGSSLLLRIEGSSNFRTMAKFNESQIQSAVGGSTNYIAKLQFTIAANGNNWGTTGRTIDALRLTKDWTEGNGYVNGNPTPNRGTGSGATWKCAIDPDISDNTKNNCSGVNAWDMTSSASWPFNSTPTATQNIVNHQSGVVEFDVTSDVQSYLNNTNQNYGWIVKKTDEGAIGKVDFGSKESANSPKLIITLN